MWYPPPNYEFKDLGVLPSHKFDKKALIYRKKLILFNPDIRKAQVYVSNNGIRKILKKHQVQKMIQMEFKPTAFPYYEMCLRGYLRKLTFEKYHVYEKPTAVKPPSTGIVKPFLGYFKVLRSLVVLETFLFKYMKEAKKLKNLQELEFMLIETQVPFIANLFRNLNCLQKVSLILLRDPEPPQNLTGMMTKHSTWTFLRDLFRLKSLKMLKLKLQDCLVSKEAFFFCNFLKLLSQSTVNEFDIQIVPVVYENTEIEVNLDAKKVLSQLTALCLYLSDYLHSFRSFKQTKQAKKKLSLSLTPKNENDLSQMLAYCSSLQELQIHTFQSKLFVSKDFQLLTKQLKVIDIQTQSACDPTALELMTCLANRLKPCNELKVLNFELNEMNENVLQEFAECLPKSLKEFSFKMLGARVWNLPLKTNDNLSLQPFCSKMLSLFTQSLGGLQSLKVLELSLNLKEPTSAKYLEPLFGQLVNLTHLDLVIYSLNPNLDKKNEKGYFDINMEKLSNLCYLKFHCSEDFGISNLCGFFKSLTGLKKINNLLVLCPNLESTTPEIIQSIAQSLVQIQTTWQYFYLGSYQNIIRNEMNKLLQI